MRHYIYSAELLSYCVMFPDRNSAISLLNTTLVLWATSIRERVTAFIKDNSKTTSLMVIISNSILVKYNEMLYMQMCVHK